MEKYLEISARSEDEAIEKGLSQLKLDRDDVSVEILQRAKKGFLGIGSSPAVVKLSYTVPDEKKPAATERKNSDKPKDKQKASAVVKEAAAPKAPAKAAEAKPAKAVEAKPAKTVESKPNKAPAENTSAATVDENSEYAEIRGFLDGLFQHMGVKADMEIGPRSGGGIDVKLSGNAMGSIIGRRGETLDAIQHLTNYAVNHGSDKRMHINVDAEGYRSKREDSLVHLAEKMAEKAIKYKRSMALEPMNSYERHVIHTALQDYEGVTTASTGEEPNRRVVVTPVKSEGQKGGSGRSSKAAKPQDSKKSSEKPAKTESVKTESVKVEAAEKPIAVEQKAPSASTVPNANKPKSREWA